MSSKKQEFSESGQPVYRYESAEPTKIEASLVNPAQKEIDEHIHTYFGEVKQVFHEILPVKIHVDILLIEPKESRDFVILVTSGLSVLPMNPPQQYSHFTYSELFLCLPKTWKIAQEELQAEENYWPFRCLKFLARFPHDYKTWIWNMHTLPNGDPAEPFAANTGLCCVMLSNPKRISENGYKLRINQDKTIYFHSVIPIYREEMEYKLKFGAEALLERFNSRGVDELIDPSRSSVVKKRLFGFS